MACRTSCGPCNDLPRTQHPTFEEAEIDQVWWSSIYLPPELLPLCEEVNRRKEPIPTEFEADFEPLDLSKMMKHTIWLILFVFSVSCAGKEESLIDDTDAIEQNLKIILEEKVFSKEEQDALTPDMVLEKLIEGNLRFKRNTLTARNHSSQVRNSVQGQFPKAVVLSCLDSRIPVEDVFDKGIGDLFVARVAGNFANPEILGSMEFACMVAGAKLVLILGHQHCGAVKASIDDVQIGNIATLANGIRPAVDMAADYTGERSSENDPYVHYVSTKNVLHTVDHIRRNSPILKDMEDKGLIKIVGAMYQMQTGNVEFYK